MVIRWLRSTSAVSDRAPPNERSAPPDMSGGATMEYGGGAALMSIWVSEAVRQSPNVTVRDSTPLLRLSLRSHSVVL